MGWRVFTWAGLLVSWWVIGSCQQTTSGREDGEAAGAPLPGVNRPGDGKFLGLSKDEAMAVAQREGRRARVVREEGVPRAITKDYRPQRVNFEVEQGLVVKVTRG